MQVTAADQLATALHNAWGLNRHSVVEVITDRTDNVVVHKAIQAQVSRAVRHAYSLAAAAAPLAAGPGAAGVAGSASGASAIAASSSDLCIAEATVAPFALPLARPLTTTATCQDASTRRGWLLRVALRDASGREAVGVGEASPLPGLHAESHQQAGAQLQLVASLLAGSRRGSAGAAVPPTLALAAGDCGAWLEGTLGLPAAALYPSVRFALECALLGALAEARGWPLARLLDGGGAAAAARRVRVNGLLPGTGSAEEVRRRNLWFCCLICDTAARVTKLMPA